MKKCKIDGYTDLCEAVYKLAYKDCDEVFFGLDYNIFIELLGWGKEVYFDEKQKEKTKIFRCTKVF